MSIVNREFVKHVLSEAGQFVEHEVSGAFDGLLNLLAARLPFGRELQVVRTKLEEAHAFAQRGVQLQHAVGVVEAPKASTISAAGHGPMTTSSTPGGTVASAEITPLLDVDNNDEAHVPTGGCVDDGTICPMHGVVHNPAATHETV